MLGSIGPQWFGLRPCHNSGSAMLLLAIYELKYVLQYIVINKLSINHQLILVFLFLFSVALAQSTTGITTATTMATAGRNGPLAPHMRPCAPRQHVEWMGANPPSFRMYSLGVLRVFMALKALLCSGDDESPQHRSVLRAIHTLNSPQKYIRKLRGLSPIHLTCRCRAQGLMWGARGPFLSAVAMVSYGCVGWCWPLEAYVRSTYLGIVKIVYKSIFYSYVDPIHSWHLTRQLNKEDLDLHTLSFRWCLCPGKYGSLSSELVLPIIEKFLAPLEVGLEFAPN